MRSAPLQYPPPQPPEASPSTSSPQGLCHGLGQNPGSSGQSRALHTGNMADAISVTARRWRTGAVSTLASQRRSSRTQEPGRRGAGGLSQFRHSDPRVSTQTPGSGPLSAGGGPSLVQALTPSPSEWLAFDDWDLSHTLTEVRLNTSFIT